MVTDDCTHRLRLPRKVTRCSPGHNLSPHNFVSVGGCFAKNEFLNSRRRQCLSETGLRKSKNTDV